uniref:Uncharacterized protein n=1 Tax=Bubo bubo TaxID=30461 RepID=A0A8C0FC34_BUBBB
RKPSGRLEVIQLMTVMDSMLEKAGVDKLIRVTGPSQVDNSLAQQNIYNIVFHELIRQLLSKLRSSLGVFRWCKRDLCFQVNTLFYSFYCRQRYVSLLEWIPEQMKTLCKQMMAQWLVNRHITEELLCFKETVEQLARSESCLILRNYLYALEYQQLYELQRRRLEEQVLLLARERDVCSSAAYDLALKDTGDLADLQEETEQFRERLGRTGAGIERSEESSRGKLQIVCSSLNKQLHGARIQPRGDPTFGGTASLLLSFQMLKEDLEQYRGEVHLRRTEGLRSAASLQEHWTELGQTVLSRHRDSAGAWPPQHAALAEINQRARELCQQYNTRISGNNERKRRNGAIIGWTPAWQKVNSRLSEALIVSCDLNKGLGSTAQTYDPKLLQPVNSRKRDSSLF